MVVALHWLILERIHSEKYTRVAKWLYVRYVYVRALLQYEFDDSCI